MPCVPIQANVSWKWRVSKRKSLQVNEATRQQVNESTSQQVNKTTSQQVNKTTSLQDDKSTSQQDNKSASQQEGVSVSTDAVPAGFKPKGKGRKSKVNGLKSEVKGRKKDEHTIENPDSWIGLPCPACKEGHIIKGKTAYGCSRWKEGCTWRKPFEEK